MNKSKRKKLTALLLEVIMHSRPTWKLDWIQRQDSLIEEKGYQTDVNGTKIPYGELSKSYVNTP